MNEAAVKAASGSKLRVGLSTLAPDLDGTGTGT